MRCFHKDDWYGLAARLACACVACLPRQIALSFGVLLGTVACRFASHQRELARKHIALSLDLENTLAVNGIVRRCFQNMGKNVIEFMGFPHTSNAQMREMVTVQGRTHVDSALAHGKGAIILTAHFGNWELLAATLVVQVAPLQPIARRLRSRSLDTLVRAYRESVGYLSIDRDKATRDALRCLKRNELLGILADVDTSVDGVLVNFFGRPAYTPYSPIAIALKTGAAILPTFIVRQPDDSHRVIIEPPLRIHKSGNRAQDFLINTQNFTEIIESYVRRYPEQWIWMHERWKTQPRDLLSA